MTGLVAERAVGYRDRDQGGDAAASAGDVDDLVADAGVVEHLGQFLPEIPDADLALLHDTDGSRCTLVYMDSAVAADFVGNLVSWGATELTEPEEGTDDDA